MRPLRPRAVRSVLARTAAVALATSVLVGCSGGAAPDPSSVGSPSTDSSPSDSVTASPPGATSTTAGSAVSSATATADLALGGTELGVTQIGAPFDEAVAAVTVVLGQPQPATGVTCIGATSELAWPDLSLAEKNGQLAGWYTSSAALASPSGVRIGTTLAVMTSLYGSGLMVFPPNTDGGPSFTVAGVDFGGDLSEVGDKGTITSLYSGFCSGP